MSFLRKIVKKTKKDKGQVLGTAVTMGVVVLIFALAMVYMLRTTINLNVNTNAGTNAALGSDAVIAKSVNILEQGNNWGTQPNLSFTPIPGYKGDTVYMDIPNTMYIVQINPGNLTTSPGDQPKGTTGATNLGSPPGDKAFERTITVDMYSLPPNYPTPSAAPTPWNQGGPAPVSFLNHRTIQEVVRRGSTGFAISADGTIQVGGHWQVWWGDVYDYYQVAGAGASTTTVLTLGNSQGLGPGYPSFHTQQGCISSSGSCAGCFGGAGGYSGSTYCQTTDSGALNCQMYPNDPNMPPEPSVDLVAAKTKAQTIYSPGSGQLGNGFSSGESGYFYNTAMVPTPSFANSVSVKSTGTGGAGAAVEANHQYSGSFTWFHSTPSNVITRMQQNMGLSSSWVGNDDLYFFVDTTDGQPMSYVGLPGSYTYPNGCGTADFKQAAFRGFLFLMGSFDDGGSGGGGPATPMAPASSAWCPTSFTGNPDFNGFVYVAGDFSSNGNPQFYGSIDIKGSVSGHGTPEIYFRNDFNYSLVSSGAIGSERWQEVKSFPTPLP